MRSKWVRRDRFAAPAAVCPLRRTDQAGGKMRGLSRANALFRLRKRISPFDRAVRTRRVFFCDYRRPVERGKHRRHCRSRAGREGGKGRACLGSDEAPGRCSTYGCDGTIEGDRTIGRHATARLGRARTFYDWSRARTTTRLPLTSITSTSVPCGSSSPSLTTSTNRSPKRTLPLGLN